jgi:hypothetical protein
MLLLSRIFLLHLCLCLLAPASGAPYRIQYRSFKWNVIEQKSHKIFYVRGCDTLAQLLDRAIPASIARLNKRTFSSLPGKLSIILYPSPDQLYESNAGTQQPAQPFPFFVRKGNRLLLAYTGSVQVLLYQLESGIAKGIWESQISRQEAIPSWFKEGLIDYFATGWTLENELEWKTLIGNNTRSWETLTREHPLITGKAFCYYLERQFKAQAPTDLFLHLKKKPDFNAATRLVTQQRPDSLYKACYRFYTDRYKTDVAGDTVGNTLYTLPLAKGTLRNISRSPDAQSLLYCLEQEDKRVVYLYDAPKKSSKRILRYLVPPGTASFSLDPSPLFTWEDDNSFVILLPQKGKILQRRYARAGQLLETQQFPEIDGVKQLAPAGAAKNILLAYGKGQTDMVRFDPKKQRYTALTNDFKEEKELTAAPGNCLGFMAISNSITDSSRCFVNSINLYCGPDNNSVLMQDTLTYQNWSNLHITDQGKVLAACTWYGRKEWFLVGQDSVTRIGSLLPDDPYAIQPGKKHDTLRVYKSQGNSPYDTSLREPARSSWLADYTEKQLARNREDSLAGAPPKTASFLEQITAGSNAPSGNRKQKALVYPYRLELYNMFFSAQFSNDYLINRYQPYQSYLGQFKFPEPGAMAKAGFSDIFENHHFDIGFRIPAGDEGSDFYIGYKNTAKRLDWGLSWFRKVESLTPARNNWTNEKGDPYPAAAKVKTQYYTLSLLYPLNYKTALEFSANIRTDKTVFLATDLYSLHFPALYASWSINSLACKYDNLKQLPFGFHKGLNLQLHADLFKGFAEPQPLTGATSMDVSYHRPLWKGINLVSRVQAGYSFGQQYILYNMGGIDNNLAPQTDKKVQFAQTLPYSFQSLVTPLRGYQQNSLYGSSYALLNADLWFPLFQSLIPLKTRFHMINNLQLGLFSDLGIAGAKGDAPAQRFAFGCSARTTLAGYRIGADIGWPASLQKSPIVYFSIKI